MVIWSCSKLIRPYKAGRPYIVAAAYKPSKALRRAFESLQGPLRSAGWGVQVAGWLAWLAVALTTLAEEK